MADEVKNGLSGDPSRIASQWNRSTVADGSWLQKYTLSPLTARDYYLASAIDELSSATDDSISALSAAISSVSAIHDEYINYLSATISGDISGYIDYVSGQVDSLSSEFKTSADAISSKLDNEIQRATEVEEVLQNQINLINASTDVINVYGSYGGENGFSVESAYYFDPAKTATYHLTNNDIIKIINDEYTPVEETGQTTTGHQTYYQWINNEGITGDPQRPSDGSWNFIGYTEPYYNIAEVNNKFTDISATVANTYLSAKGAVHQGKNIVVTENSTKPEITISTSADVEFTTVSSNGFSGTYLSGINQHGTIDNLFGSAHSGANASAWLAANTEGTSAKYAKSAGSATIAYQAQYLGNVGSADLIGSAQSGKYAWNIFSGTKITGYNGTTPNTAYLSGGFAIKAGDNLTLTYADKTFTLNAGDTGVTSISSVSPAVKFTSANIAFSAGNETTFTTANNILGINASNTLINSAKSGQSAYNWITTKSATLSAGPGIGFVSAGPNILGISAEGTTYSNGRCIEIDNNKINLSSTISADNIIMSGVDGGTNVSAYYSPSGIHLKRAGQPGPEVYLTPFDISSVVPNGQMSSITSTTSWDALMNSHYVSAATQPLTFSSAPPNIVPSEMIDNVIYLI